MTGRKDGIGVNKEDIKAFILSKIIIGKTYKLRSGYADTQDYSKKRMVPMEVYPHFILFRDESGILESFTYGELFRTFK